MADLPNRIADEKELEELLSTPNGGVIKTLSHLEGDLLILGVGGKMGPTLARMAKRALDQAGNPARVIGVSRFTNAELAAQLQEQGIETIRCDLLNPQQLKNLPDAANIIYMAGMKFGTTGQEPLTWAMNSYLPGMVCRRFPKSRMVAFSTGNVYPLTSVTSGGSVERDPLDPVGEYAMSCLGRERIFSYFSEVLEIPVALLRLNYAVEMRYGVLVDIARRVWEEEVIDLQMGNVNVIWQGDANAMALQAFDYASVPAFVVNVAGPELLSVRKIAEQFGQRFGKEVQFAGTESGTALLSNGQVGHQLFGNPSVCVQQMMDWIADWVQRGGRLYDKPTHFDVRDGQF